MRSISPLERYVPCARRFSADGRASRVRVVAAETGCASPSEADDPPPSNSNGSVTFTGGVRGAVQPSSGGAFGSGGTFSTGGLSGGGGALATSGGRDSGGSAGFAGDSRMSGGTPSLSGGWTSTGGVGSMGGKLSAGGMIGAGGEIGTSEGPTPQFPGVSGTCPEFKSGTATVGGLRVALQVGTKMNGTGSLLFYWHGTGSSASEVNAMLPAAVRKEILGAGGIIASFASTTGSGGDCSGTATFAKDDFKAADVIAACAVRDHAIALLGSSHPLSRQPATYKIEGPGSAHRAANRGIAMVSSWTSNVAEGLFDGDWDAEGPPQ